ncbi:MAG: group II intron reverse transcriptase/maturase [Pseudobdellovibrionaceae bacterium]|nr:group II intron reverse transcriptase/maturase [Pseudobdellovibrionaceae bacterium]
MPGNSHPGNPSERRVCQSIELLEGNMQDISRSDNVSTKQKQIAELSKRRHRAGLTSLNKHLDFEWLREAWRRTRKSGATGVDKHSAADFEIELSSNLTILLDGLKSGDYHAPPVKRVYLPKGGGKWRPIGIPTIGDKVAQQAILMLIEPVFEQDFLDCSYGFRKGKSAHQACERLGDFLHKGLTNYVVEADISQFFDHLVHKQLRGFLRERISDGVVLRLIDKWLCAGAIDRGSFKSSEAGSPQGGIVSPILANLYLHKVLDQWFYESFIKELEGEALLVRYCDDFCIACRNKGDAEKVLEQLHKRFSEFGLTLHADKTRIVPFCRPFPNQTKARKVHTETFDLLGFTFFWGLSRRGHWIVKRMTSRKRFSRSLKNLSDWCRQHMHEPIRVQLDGIVLKLRGHKNYFGIIGNSRRCDLFQYFGLAIWRGWLSRRSSSGYVDLARMSRILQLHPYFRRRTAMG